MSIAGLFAGIGGFERAFGHEGFETALLCDNDEAAQAVLRHRFPDVELVGDVRAIAKLPRNTEIVTAGFPCQNLSMAGDKEGIAGEKSSVVDQMFRLVRRADVPTVVIENVYFMLHLERGAAMDHLTTKFEQQGYHWAYRVVDTAAFGLPQRRRRVYLVASRTIDPRSVLLSDNVAEPPVRNPSRNTPLGFYWTEGRSGFGLAVDGIPPLKGGSGVGIPSAPAVLFPNGQVLTPGISASERLQGFPKGWTSAASGFPRRPQGRLLGNAVSVPAARWVAHRIKHPVEPKSLAVDRLPYGASWPNAAYNVGQGRFAVSISSHPRRVAARSIQDFVDPSWTPISVRALSGFVRRAKEGNLNFPEGFILRLEDELARISADNKAA